jgi:hypothetical protein
VTAHPLLHPDLDPTLPEPLLDNVTAAAERVDFRLAYDATDEPRRMHGWGINGPMIPNAYYGRGLDDSNRQPISNGDWEDPDHPPISAPEDEHIERWFVAAVSESIHEALEWFWVDGRIFLDPHGKREDAIHALSTRFANDLLALRNQTKDNSDA